MEPRYLLLFYNLMIRQLGKWITIVQSLAQFPDWATTSFASVIEHGRNPTIMTTPTTTLTMTASAKEQDTPRSIPTVSEATPLANNSSSNNKKNTTKKERIAWMVRPATLDDAAAVSDVLSASYSQVMKPDKDPLVLSRALPYLSTARESLLTCGTWYVVQHPTTLKLVGCGGWTAQAPKRTNLAESSNPLEDDRELAVVVPHLRHFACHPDWIRCGVGQALWDRTWKDLSEQFGPDTDMEVFSTLTAVPFYSSLGFEPQQPVELPLDGKSVMFPAVLMRRKPNDQTTNP